MTDELKATMYLGQAALSYRKAGMLEEAAAVKALLQKLCKQPVMPLKASA